jgi:hypothetical protein
MQTCAQKAHAPEDAVPDPLSAATASLICAPSRAPSPIHPCALATVTRPVRPSTQGCATAEVTEKIGGSEGNRGDSATRSVVLLPSLRRRGTSSSDLQRTRSDRGAFFTVQMQIKAD